MKEFREPKPVDSFRVVGINENVWVECESQKDIAIVKGGQKIVLCSQSDILDHDLIDVLSSTAFDFASLPTLRDVP